MKYFIFFHSIKKLIINHIGAYIFFEKSCLSHKKTPIAYTNETANVQPQTVQSFPKEIHFLFIHFLNFIYHVKIKKPFWVIGSSMSIGSL